MKILHIQGKEYQVMRSNREDKKYMIDRNGNKIHFGAKGYSIAPGTRKGDRYCARSSGIKNNGAFSPNSLSRKMWNCQGKRSIK